MGEEVFLCRNIFVNGIRAADPVVKQEPGGISASDRECLEELGDHLAGIYERTDILKNDPFGELVCGLFRDSDRVSRDDFAAACSSEAGVRFPGERRSGSSAWACRDWTGASPGR